MRQFNPLHFLDPATFSKGISKSSTDEPARPVMITGTKRGFEVLGRENDCVGDITTLHDDYKNRTAPETNIGWMVDANRNHVAGVLGYGKGNAVTDSHNTTNWLYRVDGVWALGRIMYQGSRRSNLLPFVDGGQYLSGQEANPGWIMREIAMSDGSPCYNNRESRPSMIFPAASWAFSTFPRDGASEELRDTRLALAEALYKENFAFLGLQIQSHRRHWGDDPRQAVVDRGVEIPKPHYAFSVSGTVSSRKELTAEQERVMRAVDIAPSQVVTESAFNVSLPNGFDGDNPSSLQVAVQDAIQSQNPIMDIRSLRITNSSSVITGLKDEA